MAGMMDQLAALALGSSSRDGSADRFRQQLRPFLRGIAAEYGAQGDACDVPPHAREVGPFTDRIELDAGQVQEVDVAGALRREGATRGHVANVGDSALLVSWRSWASDSWDGDYELPPGAVLDHSSWIVRALRIEAPADGGPVRAQLLAQ